MYKQKFLNFIRNVYTYVLSPYILFPQNVILGPLYVILKGLFPQNSISKSLFPVPFLFSFSVKNLNGQQNRWHQIKWQLVVSVIKKKRFKTGFILMWTLEIYYRYSIVCWFLSDLFLFFPVCVYFRIVDLFTHNEADDVKDRKDKFKRFMFHRYFNKTGTF